MRFLQTLTHHPRRLFLRRAAYQIHLWSGLLIGLLATLSGLTGSAIVYREALDRKLAPTLYRATPAPALPAEQVLARLHQNLPTYTPQSLDIEQGRQTWVIHLSPSKTAYVDPATGAVLGLRGSRDHLTGWLAALHTELLAGRTGTWVNGCGAIGLFLLSVTGILLWWPGRGRVRRALRIRLPGRWRRFNFDLHAAGGFWIALPLALQAFTGIFLCFGFGLLITLLGGKPTAFSDLTAAPTLTQPCLHPQANLAAILTRAATLHPNPADVFVELPTSPRASLVVFSRTPADLRTGQVTVTAFDPCTRAVLKDADSRRSSPALRTVLYLDAFHFGLIGGNLTRIAWVALGLTPGTLFFTGLLLWLRRLRP